MLLIKYTDFSRFARFIKKICQMLVNSSVWQNTVTSQELWIRWVTYPSVKSHQNTIIIFLGRLLFLIWFTCQANIELREDSDLFSQTQHFKRPYFFKFGIVLHLFVSAKQGSEQRSRYSACQPFKWNGSHIKFCSVSLCPKTSHQLVLTVLWQCGCMTWYPQVQGLASR